MGEKVIKSLFLADFRNQEKREFYFSEPKTLFLGPNGAGKSNIIEAIGFLSVLRSFRGASWREMIRHGAAGFVLSSEVNSPLGKERLEIRQSGSRRELFISGKAISKGSEFIREFRAVVFAPEDLNIVGGGAMFRRRYFDILGSMLENEYLEALSVYNRSLKQRNRAIKEQADEGLIAAFEPLLAQSGALVSRKRGEYVERVCREVNHLLDNRAEFGIKYRATLALDAAAAAEQLRAVRGRDRLRGFTTVGPQQDEIDLFFNDRELRNFGSSGQKRIISLFLRLAELRLLKDSSPAYVAALCDDVTGELDRQNYELFLQEVSRADQQFFTFTRAPESEYFADAQKEIFTGDRK